MDWKAQDFAAAGGITADYIVTKYTQTSGGQAQGLLEQSHSFLLQHALTVDPQLALRPAHLTIPWEDLDKTADKLGTTPTHVLRVHKSASTLALLFPCHALVYALQCGSLPCLSSSGFSQEQGSHRLFPLIALPVPRPDAFSISHRYLSTRDTSALLDEVLPFKHIAGTDTFAFDATDENASEGGRQAHQRAVLTLVGLSTRSLSGDADTVRAC
jgi:hypothetical protein